MVLIVRNDGRFDHILLGPNAKLVLVREPDWEEHIRSIFDNVCAHDHRCIGQRGCPPSDIMMSEYLGGGILEPIAAPPGST